VKRKELLNFRNIMLLKSQFWVLSVNLKTESAITQNYPLHIIAELNWRLFCSALYTIFRRTWIGSAKKPATLAGKLLSKRSWSWSK